ncbi:MAG: GtrA family protein [Clostridia bacterium]|nr:GtrA family protein [Clostridia bacterium]
MRKAITDLAGQFVRYSLVGGVAAAADISLYYMGTGILAFNHLLANTLSFSVGLIVNYFLSREWVFNHYEHKFGRDFTLFALIGILGLGISNLLLFILIDAGALRAVFSFMESNLLKLFAKIISAFVVLLWNFSARRIAVFRTVS